MRRSRGLCALLAAALALLCAPAALAAKTVEDVTQYTYRATPIISGYNALLYVQTENPDPTSFQLVDRDTVYKSDNGAETCYTRADSPFADVRYENAETLRVHGGYIFSLDSGSSDGGTLAVQQRVQHSFVHYGETYYYSEYEDTDVTASCPALKDHVDYVIDMFTTKEMSLFEKLDAIQAGLAKYAVYPRSVGDYDQPSAAPYPSLASSPYEELGLNAHYEGMYNRHKGGMLLQSAFPFVLDSSSFPGTITAAARRLQPGVTVAREDVHWLYRISCNGESRVYGGAGYGESDPIYTNHLETLYTFDGASGDWFGKNDLQAYSDKLASFNAIAQADVAPCRDLVEGDTFVDTICATGGTWIRIGVESFFGGSTQPTFAYALPSEQGCHVLSDAWVDGRYVNSNESIQLGTAFEDHPEADIVVRQMRYTDVKGVAHQQDVRFEYSYLEGTWHASDAYYGSSTNVPAVFTLTLAQVKAMKPDANTNKFPTHALIYDGVKYPGTPCEIVTVTYHGNNGTPQCGSVPAEKGEPTAFASFSFKAPEEPEGQVLNGWLIDGVLYGEHDTHVFTEDTDVYASWYWRRLYADSFRLNIYASFDCGDDENCRGVCASYDAEGRLVSMESAALSTGDNTIYFKKPYGAVNVKVFLLDANFVPLAPCVELENVWKVYNAYM